jgi:hypothetical protein
MILSLSQSVRNVLVDKVHKLQYSSTAENCGHDKLGSKGVNTEFGQDTGSVLPDHHGAVVHLPG